MKISDMKESKYVKKEDCGENGIIVTIHSVGNENVAMENEPPEHKYILNFKEDVKPLVMNWTNIQLCAQATGSDDTDNWPGKKIVLYNDPNVSFAGKLTGGIRIRKAQQSTPSAAPVKSEDPNDDIPF